MEAGYGGGVWRRGLRRLVILSCVLVCCRIKRAQTELAFELRRRFLPLRGEAPAVATPNGEESTDWEVDDYRGVGAIMHKGAECEGCESASGVRECERGARVRAGCGPAWSTYGMALWALRACTAPGCVKRNQPQPVRFQNPSLEGGVVQFQRWSSRKACSASTVAFAAPACLATSPGRVFSRWASTAAALLSARGLAAAFGLSTSTSLSGELS